MTDELYGEALVQWLEGWRAASAGRQFDEHKPTAYLVGFRDYFALKASKADEVRNTCTVH